MQWRISMATKTHSFRLSSDLTGRVMPPDPHKSVSSTTVKSHIYLVELDTVRPLDTECRNRTAPQTSSESSASDSFSIQENLIETLDPIGVVLVTSCKVNRESVATCCIFLDKLRPTNRLTCWRVLRITTS